MSELYQTNRTFCEDSKCEWQSDFYLDKIPDDYVVPEPVNVEGTALEIVQYGIADVSLTLSTSEALSPGRPPFLTQRSIAKYLVPLDQDLNEVPPRPTIDELEDAVINKMVERDKAFWVDKPGSNAYTLHDAFDNFEMKVGITLPNKQDVFPRSYTYDLDCVRYRRTHACDKGKKEYPAHCMDCYSKQLALTPFQLSWSRDPGQKRWRYYPDLTATLSLEHVREAMNDVGLPFRHEACTWYNENYPSIKYNTILRKFGTK